MSIPVVDLSQFVSGNPATKAAFVQRFGKAYEEVGFVAVKNYSVPDEFNETFSEAYKSFQKSGTASLQAIALYLGLEESFFDNYVHNGNGILRCLYYPPITQEPKSAIRAEHHEDINLITLLVGASADGLEILTKQNIWVAVTSLPDQIVVNVGDMFQRLTNNQLCSTTHRVVNPKRELWSTSRFSIPFFLHPRSSMSLACLKSCVDGNHPKAYPDYTAGKYLDERFERNRIEDIDLISRLSGFNT